MTDVKEQWIYIKFCFKLGKMASETHRMLKEALGDNALGQTQMYEWSKHSKNGWMSGDDEEHSWPEPWPNMRQKFDSIKEFVPPGQMVNGKFCCSDLRRLRENVWCKQPDKWRNNSWALHHDSAPAHMYLVVLQFLASMKMTVIPQPPLSLDLTPCEVFLSPRMKLKLKGQRYDSIEEIQTKSQDVMKTLTQNNFQQCFWSWKSRWDPCINAEGDYFEGDGGE